MGPFSGSEMAIGGRHRAPKWPKNAINGPFVAIRHPGGYKLVDQYGSRLDQGGAHPGRWFGTIYSSRNCHLGALQRSKVAQIGHKWGIFGKKRPWRNLSPRSPFCNAEAQKPKTFRIAAFYAQKFSGRSARIQFSQHVKKARNPLSRHIKKVRNPSGKFQNRPDSFKTIWTVLKRSGQF